MSGNPSEDLENVAGEEVADQAQEVLPMQEDEQENQEEEAAVAAPPSMKREREEPADLDEIGGAIGAAGGPPQQQEEDFEAKRQKVLDNQRFPVSEVLHVRAVPPGATDDELNSLVTVVGGTLDCLVTIANRQAFFQVDSPETAMKMLVRYSDPATPALVRGQPVYIQTSNRTSLQGGRVPGQVGVPGADHSATILMVLFSDVVYPINVDVLEKVFGPCGQLSKIIVFVKNGQTMALVQFVDAEGASGALRKLNGQNIYAGCCGMNISYSNSRKDLNVHRDGPMSRDFLAPASQRQTAPAVPPGGALLPPPPAGYPPQQPPPPSSSSSSSYGGRAAYPPQQHQQQQGGYQSAGQYAAPPGGAAGGHPGDGTVVIVSQLDPNQVNPDYLFRLFGVYGDVLRVKIMFKKRDTALIQFTDRQGAFRAVQFLNNFQLWGQPVRCNISKGHEVQMPQEGNPFAAEYGFNHVMHRYRRPDSKALQYITEPNAILHISSIPLGTTEDELRSYLSSSGQAVSVKFLADGKYRQALVTMATVQQAVDGLVELHNREVQPRIYLKLNFSVAGSQYSKEERLARQQYAPQQNYHRGGGAGGRSYGGGGGRGGYAPQHGHHHQPQQRSYGANQQYQQGGQQQQHLPQGAGGGQQYAGYATGSAAYGSAPPTSAQATYAQQQYYAGQARK